MALYEVKMWRLGCDFPGCGAAAQDDTEYHAWADQEGAVHDAESAEWLKGPSTWKPVPYYCTDHQTVWASELETQEPDEWEHSTLRGVVWPVLLLNDISKLADGEAYLCELRSNLASVMTRLERDA